MVVFLSESNGMEVGLWLPQFIEPAQFCEEQDGNLGYMAIS
jgi:hypothetical protein